MKKYKLENLKANEPKTTYHWRQNKQELTTRRGMHKMIDIISTEQIKALYDFVVGLSKKT